MANFYYYNWEEVDINWENLDMNWEEVGILKDLVGGGGLIPVSGRGFKVDLKKINELPEEKKRVIIKLAIKLEGKEFVEYKYRKKDINVTAKHMNIILDKISNKIKVNVQNIS